MHDAAEYYDRLNKGTVSNYTISLAFFSPKLIDEPFFWFFSNKIAILEPNNKVICLNSLRLWSALATFILFDYFMVFRRKALHIMAGLWLKSEQTLIQLLKNHIENWEITNRKERQNIREDISLFWLLLFKKPQWFAVTVVVLNLKLALVSKTSLLFVYTHHSSGLRNFVMQLSLKICFIHDEIFSKLV